MQKSNDMLIILKSAGADLGRHIIPKIWNKIDCWAPMMLKGPIANIRRFFTPTVPRNLDFLLVFGRVLSSFLSGLLQLRFHDNLIKSNVFVDDFEALKKYILCRFAVRNATCKINTLWPVFRPSDTPGARKHNKIKCVFQK